MKRVLGLATFCLFFAPAFTSADDLKADDLIGKWELTEEASGIPQGSTFDFQKDGTLVIGVVVKGEQKMFSFKYELKAKEKVLAFTINNKTDTTEVVTLNKEQLICKDKDGVAAKFKRMK